MYSAQEKKTAKTFIENVYTFLKKNHKCIPRIFTKIPLLSKFNKVYFAQVVSPFAIMLFQQSAFYLGKETFSEQL